MTRAIAARLFRAWPEMSRGETRSHHTYVMGHGKGSPADMRVAGSTMGHRAIPSIRLDGLIEAREAAHDDAGPHGLAWTRGAGALRTGWKRIGVTTHACGKVRGVSCFKTEGRLAL